MFIDRSANLKPSEVKRFNTVEILFYFVNLLSPEKFKDLDTHTKAVLAEIGNALAQLGKDIQNALPREIEKIKAHLGKPAAKSQPEAVLTRLNQFESNDMPNMLIQQDARKKELEVFRTQLELLIAQGANIDISRLERLKEEIQQFKTSKVQALLDQRLDLSEKLGAIRDDAGKVTGTKVAPVDLELEEKPVAAATSPAAAPSATTTTAAPTTPPTSQPK